MPSDIKKKKIGFFIHPRDLEDFYIKYPLARYLPKKLVERISLLLPPVIVSRITGLIDKDGESIEGYVLAVPMPAHLMMEHRERVVKKMKQGIKLAKKKGIALIALGGLTASLSRGGLDVLNSEGVGITTGRAYTVKTVTDYVISLCDKYSFDRSSITIGIVGAGGSIGKGCALTLERKNFKNFILIDREDKIMEVKMEAISESPDVRIETDHKLERLKAAHIVIAATNAPEAVILSRDLTPGTIVINDAQPSDVSLELYKEDDIIIIEGGVVSTPGISCNVNMGLSSGDDNFCCAVEAFILAHNGMFEDFSTGYLSLDNIEKLDQMSESFFASLPPYQNMYGYINPDKIDAVASLINERISST